MHKLAKAFYNGTNYLEFYFDTSNMYNLKKAMCYGITFIKRYNPQMFTLQLFKHFFFFADIILINHE